MKKAFLIIYSLILLFSVCNAQDIIRLQSGKNIECSVIEINDDIITYKLLGTDATVNAVTINKNEVSEVIFKDGAIIQINKSLIRPGMNYKQYRKLFDYKDYTPWEFDPYNPGVSRVMSFFIPGLGQFTDYEYGRACAFFFGSLACLITGTILIVSGAEAKSDGMLAGGLAFIAGDLTLRIVGTIDAIRVAKIKNMYEHRLHGLKASERVSFDPTIYKMGNSNNYGVGITLSYRF